MTDRMIPKSPFSYKHWSDYAMLLVDFITHIMNEQPGKNIGKDLRKEIEIFFWEHMIQASNAGECLDIDLTAKIYEDWKKAEINNGRG